MHCSCLNFPKEDQLAKRKRGSTAQRSVKALVAQSDRSTARLTGRNCDHSQCKQVRLLATQTILRDGPKGGFTHLQCRQVVAQLPKLLCDPARVKGLSQRQAILLQVVFITACEDVGATGLVGQSASWYQPMRKEVLRIATQGDPDQKPPAGPDDPAAGNAGN
jgi:hypothetical protein